MHDQRTSSSGPRPPAPRPFGRGAARAARFAAAFFAASAAAAAPAGAQPRAPAIVDAAEVEGAVLALQGDELLLDLGSTQGASDGAAVEIWRPLKVKHPVTGKVLTDRFRIGALELLQVRSNLSLARASGALTRPAAVGDVVILARRAAPAAPAGPAPGAAAAAPEDPDARAVSEMFDALRGADLATRIAHYEEYAKSNPKGRYVRVLGEEAAALRELHEHRAKAAEKVLPEVRGFSWPKEAIAGQPLRLAVEANDATTGMVLHVRRRGAPSYVSHPMAPISRGYFAATIPAAEVVAPGIEYFMEGIPESGKPIRVMGGGDAPRHLDVFEPPKPTAPRRLPMKVEFSAEYADYNRWRHNDYVFQTEGFFGIRYGDKGIRALRLGFGVYRGRGGGVDDLDKLDMEGRAVGLTYGYVETEIGFVSAFSIIGRGAVGLVDTGISGGGQILLRIGNDLKTNLLLGGELLGGVGLRGIAQLELNTFERFPIVLRSEVTNQPAGVTASSTSDNTSSSTGNVGGRGIVQLGFRVTPALVVAVRGSFQGRNIQHAGPGLGGLVAYQW